jgi:3-dehydroquinate synthase
MSEIQVKLEPRYSVVIAQNLLERVGVPHARVALIADRTAAKFHLDKLVSGLEAAGSSVEVFLIPSGEACKSLEIFSGLLSSLAQVGLTRDAAVVALGGGATSDLAGYVAASYLRGIAFYVCPTTLLAMVDASVGGKTGVNLPEGKNLVGAFHQPKAVFASLETLKTLPERTFREGAAEAFKHGLIANPALMHPILEPGFNATSPTLESFLTDAIQVKADVVAIDPFEKHERAFLNYGHTLAHALEAVTHHKLPHGEAVGYGMHYAAIVGVLLGYQDLTAHTKAFLEYQQPAKLPALEFADVEPFMARDKKADSEGVRFVMLHEIAKPNLERVSKNVLLEAWNEFATQFSAK